MIKNLLVLTATMVLTLFYAFFTQLCFALNILAKEGNYALWARSLLIVSDFILILIPLHLIHFAWFEYASECPNFYKKIGKKFANATLLVLSIVIISYIWTNAYENL